MDTFGFDPNEKGALPFSPASILRVSLGVRQSAVNRPTGVQISHSQPAFGFTSEYREDID